MDQQESNPKEKVFRKPYESPVIGDLGNVTDLTAQFEVSVIGH